jgi:ankyrin repeat protein
LLLHRQDYDLPIRLNTSNVFETKPDEVVPGDVDNSRNDCPRVTPKHYEGQHPLFLAIDKGLDILARLMVRNGADLTVMDQRGRQPLLAAIDEDLDMLARLMVQKDADTNAVDHEGRRPLLVAIDKGLDMLARLMVRNGAISNFQQLHKDTGLSNETKKSHSPHIEKAAIFPFGDTIESFQGNLWKDVLGPYLQRSAGHSLRKNEVFVASSSDNRTHIAFVVVEMACGMIDCEEGILSRQTIFFTERKLRKPTSDTNAGGTIVQFQVETENGA